MTRADELAVILSLSECRRRAWAKIVADACYKGYGPTAYQIARYADACENYALAWDMWCLEVFGRFIGVQCDRTIVR